MENEKAMDKLAALCRIRGVAEQTLDALVDDPTDEKKLTAALHQIGGVCTLACGIARVPYQVKKIKSPSITVLTAVRRVEGPRGGNVMVGTIMGECGSLYGKIEDNGFEIFSFSSKVGRCTTEKVVATMMRKYLTRLDNNAKRKSEVAHEA